MTGVAGRRIVTEDGAALLADGAGAPEAGVPAALAAGGTIFEPAYWRSHGRLEPAGRGRGSAWLVGDAARDWVLRHYRRGGFAARICTDRYLWAGEARVRSFAEWRLLADLWKRGLPVPRPVAARYQRRGPFYRCDLITQRIAGARPLSELLAAGELPDSLWRAVGAAVAELHRAGADHADLNAHNVLVDGQSKVSFVDFDRGRLRGDGGWPARNLARLRRSLHKLGRARGEAALARDWGELLRGYGSAARPGPRRPPA